LSFYKKANNLSFFYYSYHLLNGIAKELTHNLILKGRKSLMKKVPMFLKKAEQIFIIFLNFVDLITAWS